MRSRRWTKAFALLFAISLVAAACGDSGDGDTTAATDATTTTLEEGQTGTTQFASTTVADGQATTTTEEAMDDVSTAHLLRPENIPTDDQRGGTVVLGYTGAIPHVNGAVSSGYAVNTAGSQVNASLLRWSDSYQPVPYIAIDWSIADDGLSVDLTLHPEARFHDGEDITCTDVDFSIKTSKANHPFKPMFAPVTGVDGGDTKNCTVNLDQPHPALLVAFAPGLLPIIPEHIFNDGQDMKTHPRNTTDIVGSGPFKIVEFDSTEIIRYEANDDFFLSDLPYLDELIFDLVPDPATVTLGLQTGDFDIGTGHNGQDIVDAQNNADLFVSNSGFEAIGSIWWLQLNLRDPILQDKRVRQALAYAFDHDQWNDVVQSGQHRRQCTGIQSQSPYYNPAAECYDLDIEKAQSLLDEAGYSDGFTLTFHQQAENVSTMELVAEMWAKIGVTVEIELTADFPAWAQRTTAEDSDYQVTFTSLWNWGDPVIGVNRSYNCNNRVAGVAFSNMSWYCNEELDGILNQAGLEFDPDTRRDLYFQATDIINEDVPVIYMSNQVWYTRMQTNLENPPSSIWGFMDSWAEMWVS